MHIVYGCTNSSAVNYNSLATVDDGSCVTTGARHHNITGELTQELLTAGSSTNISSISLTNINFGGSTLIDLYVEKQLTGKFYLLKNVSIPVGVTLLHDIKGFNNREGEFGLYIKLTKADAFTLTGSIDPAASVIVPGSGTAFLSEVSIGDEIVVSGETRIVTSITSDTSLTVSVAFSNNSNDATPDCNPVAPVDVILS